VDRLQAENAELLARRAALEEETRGARAALSTMQHQTDAAKGDLDSMRQQAEIWQSSSSEADKVRWVWRR
jgi:chromosome segregation ATPase